jgi:hypothetical protein
MAPFGQLQGRYARAAPASGLRLAGRRLWLVRGSRRRAPVARLSLCEETNMLGERIGEDKGKVTLQRVLPNPGGPPKMETNFFATGTLFGVPATDTGTYVAVQRTDGSLFGEGQGISMSSDGDTASWVGQGVGTLRKDGSISFRGAIYFQTASARWARLNNEAVIYEYEVDAQGNTRSTLYEWK